MNNLKLESIINIEDVFLMEEIESVDNIEMTFYIIKSEVEDYEKDKTLPEPLIHIFFHNLINDKYVIKKVPLKDIEVANELNSLLKMDLSDLYDN
jgi:hypothetical protein